MTTTQCSIYRKRREKLEEQRELALLILTYLKLLALLLSYLL